MKNLFLILSAGISSAACSEAGAAPETPDAGNTVIVSDYDWNAISDKAQETLENEFWKADGK